MSDIATRLREAINFKKRDYLLVFGSPSGRRVLADLAKFCRVDETTAMRPKNGPIDKDEMLLLEGQRRVMLRIQRMMRLSNDELFDLVRGPTERIDG